jgi:hypothetical protein
LRARQGSTSQYCRLVRLGLPPPALLQPPRQTAFQASPTGKESRLHWDIELDAGDLLACHLVHVVAIDAGYQLRLQLRRVGRDRCACHVRNRCSLCAFDDDRIFRTVLFLEGQAELRNCVEDRYASGSWEVFQPRLLGRRRIGAYPSNRSGKGTPLSMLSLREPAGLYSRPLSEGGGPRG